MSKAKAEVRWTDAAALQVLEYIDTESRKGQQSLFITNKVQAVQEIREGLRPDFDPSEERIKTKIQYMWSRYKLPEHNNLKELYLHGRNALDTEKLPQALRRSAGSGPSSASRSHAGKGKAKSKVISLSTSTPKTVKSATSNLGEKRKPSGDLEETASEGQQRKRRKAEPEGVGQHRKRRQDEDDSESSVEEPSTKKARSDAGSVNARAEDDELVVPDSSENIGDTDGSMQSIGPAAGQVNGRRASAHENTASPTTGAAIEVDAPSSVAWTGNNLLDENRMTDPQPQYDEPRQIQAVMQSLQANIASTVDAMLNDLALPPQQPLSLDLDLYYPDKIARMFSMLLGCQPGSFKEKAREFLSSQNQKDTNLRSFLQSLLAAAMNDWCLSPSLSGDSFWSDLGHGAVISGLSKVAGPKQIEVMKQSMLTDYLNQRVKPMLAAKASRLARDFDHLLRFALPQLKVTITDDSLTVHDSIHYLPPRAEAASTSAGWQSRFLESVSRVFESALEWRLKTDNSGAQIPFAFPSFKSWYQRKERTPYQQQDDYKLVEEKGEVILGLMPLIQRKIRARLTGPFGPWHVVYDGANLAKAKPGADSNRSA